MLRGRGRGEGEGENTSAINTYLVFGGGGHTNVLIILSVVMRTCSGTSSLIERNFKLINDSEGKKHININDISTSYLCIQSHQQMLFEMLRLDSASIVSAIFVGPTYAVLSKGVSIWSRASPLCGDPASQLNSLSKFIFIYMRGGPVLLGGISLWTTRDLA